MRRGAAPGGRHGAVGPSGRRPLRHAHSPDRRVAGRRLAQWQRQQRSSRLRSGGAAQRRARDRGRRRAGRGRGAPGLGRRGGGRGGGRRRRRARGSQRAEAVLVRARHRRRQDGRGAGLRRGLAHGRSAHPHPPPQPGGPVQRRALRPRLQEARDRPAAGPRQGRQHRRPGHRRDLPVVRAQRGQGLRRLHDRDLRRGPHGPGGEDLRRDPSVAGPDLRGHDGHGRADRAPRDRPVPHPDLALRSGPGGPPRCDRAAALRAHPARGGRALDLQGAAAPRRGRSGLRPGGAGRAAGPDAVQPGDRRPLQGSLQGPPGRGLLGRRAPRAQRGRRVPRGRHQGQRGLGRDAQARAHPRAGRLRARRDRRAGERPAAGRGMELTARDRLHAPGAHRLAAHLPAARGKGHAPAARQGGGDRRGLRAPRHHQRRPGGHAAQPARPRRVPRRRDRRRARCAAVAAGACAWSGGCCP